jgi:hypothetical protein
MKFKRDEVASPLQELWQTEKHVSLVEGGEL